MRAERPWPRPDPGRGRKARFPVNILFWGNLDEGTALIDRHPDTRFIIDHLGIMQPRVRRAHFTGAHKKGLCPGRRGHSRHPAN